MIRGTKRELDKRPSVVNVDLNASIHNRFDIEVVDAKTGEVKQKAQAFNVVCDNLWKRLFTLPSAQYINDWSEYLQYGTGSGTPSAADTSLFSKLGDIPVFSGSVNNYDPKTGILSTTKKGQILESQHVGATITEVGLAYSSSNGSLCTHAMLQDMNGNQISILKTDTDIINLYSTVFVHMEPAKKDGVQLLPVHFSDKFEQKHVASLLSGVAFSTTYSADTRFFVTPNVYTASDVVVSGSPSMAADPTTKTWKFGPVKLPAATGNVGGLYGVGFSLRTSYNYNNYSVPFVALFAGDGWFPGSDIVGEAVGTGDGVTTAFALKFPHATEAKIYVDGVEATGVTVRNYPKSTDTAQVLQMINSESTAENVVPFVVADGSLSAISFEANKPGRVQSQTENGAYFYNPCWEIGIERLNIYKTSYVGVVEFSDDMINWEQMEITGDAKHADYYVPETLKHKKFLHIRAASSLMDSNTQNGVFFPSNMTGKAVLFDTPPAAGAVITADYHTPVIAKDENHIFEVSMTIHCGEYTEN